MAQQHSEETEQKTSVLHRKASVGKAEHQARAMSLPKALRLSLAKVADDLCEMAMAAIGVRTQRCKAADLSDIFDPEALLLLLDGPFQRRAAAVCDRGFVGGLIQQQTMGKVLPAPEQDTRVLTATDAAICAPFLDALLARSATLPEEEDQQRLLQGYRFGAHCEEPRLLMMALEQPEYDVFHLTVDMAGGARQGQLSLCFPVIEDDLDAGPEEAARREDMSGPSVAKPSQMERTVMSLHVELHIALARLQMPLSDLQALKVGSVLELGVTSFDQSIVQTRSGQRLSRGKLGQIDGIRALQLEHAPTALTAPRRRAADRALLDLPEVSGDGTGTQAPEALKQLPPAALDVMDDMPDMSDLPEMMEVASDSAAPEGAVAVSLDDEMPDLSDLPDFDAQDDEAPMTIT